MCGEGLLKRYHHIGCIALMVVRYLWVAMLWISRSLIIRDMVVSSEVLKPTNRSNLAIRDKILRETLYW